MTKEAIEKLEPLCKRIVELKNIKEAAEKELKEAEAAVKDEMNAAGATTEMVGKYTVELTHVAPSTTVDTVKLKAAGLYEQYSKPKAGYDKLVVTDPDDAQGADRRARGTAHKKGA